MRAPRSQVPGLPPADWYADPGGRHQYRYFDGIRWTDHVADDGHVQLDPLEAPRPEQVAASPPAIAQPADEPVPALAGAPGVDEQPPVTGPPAEQPPVTGPPAEQPPTPVVEPAPTPAFVTELDAEPLPTEAPAAPAAAPWREPDVGQARPAPHVARPPQHRMLPMDEAVRRCLNKYAAFSGRAPRSEYWWFALAANIALWLVALVSVTFAGGWRDVEFVAAFGSTPYVLASLALALPLLAAAVRRLHDMDRSGWTVLVALIPLVGPILLLALLAMPGSGEPNRYGPPEPAEAPSTPLVETMTMDVALRRGLRAYADFSGRATRAEYWWFALAANLSLAVVGLAGIVLAGGLLRDAEIAGVVGLLPYVLMSLALVVPLLSVAVRRLHDTGRSGLLLLLALVPVVGPIMVVVMLATRGTPGPNTYGAPPSHEGPTLPLLTTLAAAIRIPLLVWLAGAVTAAIFLPFRFGGFENAGAFWASWITTLLVGGLFVAVLLYGRRSVPSRWLLGIEGGAAAALALAPRAPWAYPWTWVDWPESVAFVLDPGLGQALAMVWLGVVAASAIWYLRPTVRPSTPAT